MLNLERARKLFTNEARTVLDHQGRGSGYPSAAFRIFPRGPCGPPLYSTMLT